MSEFLRDPVIAQFEKLPHTAIFVGLLYLALSRPAVAYDYHVARVSILVCSNALALLAFLLWLERGDRRALLWAIAANVFALLVSEQGLALLPCEALLFLVRGPRRWRPALCLALGSAAGALVWPTVRFVEFTARAHLPAGISGTIEFTKSFPWQALLQPNYLPFTNAHRAVFTETSLSLSHLSAVRLVDVPADLVVAPRWLSLPLVLVLTVSAMIDGARRKRALVWLVMSLLFLSPVALGMMEWYGMGYVVPFALLMMEGAAFLTARAEKVGTVALSAVCVVAAMAWLSASAPEPHNLLAPRGGAHFLFSRPPVTRGSAISEFFSTMPGEVGIMAPTDLSPEVLYSTGKRVVALPFDPELLDRFVDEYKISYVLTSSEFLRRYNSAAADRYTSSLITRYLAAHQDRYRLVKSVRETYPAFYPSHEYYVLEAQRR